MDKTETADKRLFVHFHRRVYGQLLNELYASRRSTPFMNDEQRLRLKIAAAKGVTVAGLLLALVLADFRFRTGLDIDTATGRAALLLQQAGGSAKVIEEVDRLLETRPVGKSGPIDASELDRYPALKSLGGAVGIYDDMPTCVRVRIPGHSLGYSELFGTCSLKLLHCADAGRNGTEDFLHFGLIKWSRKIRH